MNYNTSIQANQIVGYPIDSRAGMPTQPMPAQPVPGSGAPPQPPHRRNRQFWLGCWRHSGEQTRMRWVTELVLEKRSLRGKEKGSIRYRALAPLVTPEMWQEAEKRLDNPPLAGPLPTLPISPLAALALSLLPAPAPVFNHWTTLNPGHGVAPGFPAPAPAAAQGQIFAPGGFTPNQFPATGYQQSLPMPQPQLQPQGLSVPTRRHRLDLGDEIEAPQPKRQRLLFPGYTPSRPPPQFMPGVDQTFGNYPGQSSAAYQFSPPVIPQPFPPVAPQLTPQVQTTLLVDPQYSPRGGPRLALPVDPQFALPVDPQFASPVVPQFAHADPVAWWSAQTLPQEDLQSQELNANDLAIPEETQLGQETQFPAQFGQITNGAPAQFGEINPVDAAAEEAHKELLEEYLHANPVAAQAHEPDTHTTAATGETNEEDLYAAFINGETYEEGYFDAAFINQEAYEEDARNAPVVAEEAYEEETNALPTQSGEEINEFVPLEETHNDEESQQADPSSLSRPVDDDESPEQQDDATAQENSEQEEVDITSDEYIYGPLIKWYEHEQQFASQSSIDQVSL